MLITSKMKNKTNQAVLYDADSGRWKSFKNPVRVIEAKTIAEVLPGLHKLEELVQKENLYCAGFISYEAAPAFDDALKVKPPGLFPLLWFGLYSGFEELQPEPSHQDKDYMLGKWNPSIGYEQYSNAIALIKEYLANGDTYQVNFTFRLTAPFSGNAWSFFLDLALTQQMKYAAYIDTGQFAVCSLSPELFFRLDGREILSRPMKGTAARGRTPAEDREIAEWLRDSEKNKAENIMIVDMVRNDIGRVAQTGSVNVPGLFSIEKLPTVWQMTSTVTADTGASLGEIMSALFPCASITGAPKPRTMRIISDLEEAPRNIYTGCIGYIAPGRTARFSVAIRTVLIDREKKNAEYGVGGGIVWDSESEEEYRECMTKARIVTEKRREFALLETILWTPEEGYFLLAKHLKRLSDSADYFNFPVDMTKIGIELQKIEKSLNGKPHRIRLLLYRCGKISCESMSQDEHAGQQIPGVKLAEKSVDSSDPFLYHKTTNREVYDDAMAASPGFDDVLLWNEKDEITESCIANVVVQYESDLLTPPVSSGLLAGTFRARLLEQNMIREEIITKEMLHKCKKIFLINSVRRWREVRLEY